MRPGDVIAEHERASFQEYIRQQASALGLLGRPQAAPWLTFREQLILAMVARTDAHGDYRPLVSIADSWVAFADAIVLEMAKEPKP